MKPFALLSQQSSDASASYASPLSPVSGYIPFAFLTKKRERPPRNPSPPGHLPSQKDRRFSYEEYKDETRVEETLPSNGLTVTSRDFLPDNVDRALIICPVMPMPRTRH